MIERRAFLGQLARLPLIGGGIALIGKPTAAAEPVTIEMLEAYKSWLDHERRHLSAAMARDPIVQKRYRESPQTVEETISLARIIDSVFECNTPAWNYNYEAPGPYHRAALVMSAVGLDWREDRA